MDFTQSRLFSFILGGTSTQEEENMERVKAAGVFFYEARGKPGEQSGTTTVFGMERSPNMAWDQDLCFGLWLQEKHEHSANM